MTPEPEVLQCDVCKCAFTAGAGQRTAACVLCGECAGRIERHRRRAAPEEDPDATAVELPAVHDLGENGAG